MSISGAQRGSLRKRELPNPSTLFDLRPALMEYASSDSPWALGVAIVTVRAVDGQPIDPGKYWLFVEEDGFFRRGDLPCNRPKLHHYASC
jgi:hypothetical protein